jgi:phosphoglycolate phosphatase-like HAD superfamily hydrolase
MHLLIFDVDGTLVDSLAAEAICFPRACEEALGLNGVSSDWHSYRNPSDSGIVTELVERHFGRAASADDLERAERRFFSLLKETYGARPELCCEVAGAVVAFERAQQLPDTMVSIATAGWRTTAHLKLRVAGFDIRDVAMTTSSDAPAKVDIMRLSHERARTTAGVPRFASVTCIGDSAGDRRAAAALGFDFIGIDTSGFVSDHEPCFPDFSDWTAIADRISKRRSARCTDPSDD